MEIFALDAGAGVGVEAFGSIGVTALPLVRGEAVAVTVLRVAAGGHVGRHPAVVDQLLMVMAGRGQVQVEDGAWEGIEAGQAVVWRAGVDHATRAVEDITAVVVEMVDMPVAT